MQGATFNPDKEDKYQPISQAQIDLQHGVLKQNPGYWSKVKYYKFKLCFYTTQIE